MTCFLQLLSATFQGGEIIKYSITHRYADVTPRHTHTHHNKYFTSLPHKWINVCINYLWSDCVRDTEWKSVYLMSLRSIASDEDSACQSVFNCLFLQTAPRWPAVTLTAKVIVSPSTQPTAPRIRCFIRGLCLVFSSECITNFKHAEIKLDYSWKRTDACSGLLTCSLRVESRPVCVTDDWSTLSLSLSLVLTLHRFPEITRRFRRKKKPKKKNA